MIQTTIEVPITLRGDKNGIILINIAPYNTTLDGVTYTVNDYAIVNGGALQLIETKSVFYSNAQIDGLDAYLESVNDYSGMSKSEKDWLKIKQGLMFTVQSDLYTDGTTIYRLQPNNWEFSV